MNDTRSQDPAPRPLAQLLAQAAMELNAQPAPPMGRAMFDALPAAASGAMALAEARPARRWWSPLVAWLAPGATDTAGATGTAGSASRTGWPTVAAACSLMLVSVTVLLVLALPPGASDSRAAPGFIPVAPQERWSRLQEDGGAAWVVTTELPQARLASYGLPFDPARAADTVRAELLMRASGEVLAVRVLY